MIEDPTVLDPEEDTATADPAEVGATDPKGDQWWEDEESGG
jgi:hypothetical protein